MNSHHQLHIIFLPFMAHGHMIPLLDMARHFARHGAKSTIITTPLNAPTFSDKITRDARLGLQIQTHIIEFDPVLTGLPKGCENVNSIESPDMLFAFFKSMDAFQAPVRDLLVKWRPDAIVADFAFHWATETAHGLGIPRLFFNGMGSFATCLFERLKESDQYKKVESESDPFFMDIGISNRFRFTKMQLPPCLKGEEVESRLVEFRDRIEESEAKSYGVVVNSFHELEAEYAEYYRNVIGRKAWFVGPVSLIDNNNVMDQAAIDGGKCLKWLDSKKPNSVIYICFGSISTMSDAQLVEIAAAIEASGHGFIWVVKKQDRLPEGFEKRMEGKGLVVRGWAPQVVILDHEAVGGFMTHCGWNSTMESVAAGVPMVTWPIQAEQFLNEKLVTDVLRIGVGVGAQEWSRKERRIVLGREEIGKAVREVMVGEDVRKMRMRAAELKESAKRADEEGGSSHCDLKSLLEELSSLKGKIN
uniref:Glycosyltransferase n=1 Tax=Linum usitatissimum TaxID=4006 RepID=I2BH52_LINUS|nr:UDP-glycosyltransferase 1 [Linum usitatissimum]